LHNHVSRLRKVLGSDLLATRAWGYVLRADPEQIDLHRFERLLADAEPLPAKERSAKLAEALALWRGPALADLLFEPAVAEGAARLEELRLAALEACIDADLELGRNAELIGELEALVAKHPLRERLRGQLILALYRDGRQAEALAVYRETRRLLATELGLEPSPALRELERAILRQDPSIAPVAPRTGRADDLPIMRRKSLVYAALGSGAILAGGGIVAFAALRSNKGAQPTSATAAPAAQTQAAKPHRVARTARGAPRAAARKPQTHRAAKPMPVHSPVATKRVPVRQPHRQQTTAARSSTKKQPAKRTTVHDVRITDDFSTETVDPQIWTVATTGTGVDATQGNGHLEITIHADATPASGWPSYSGSYLTKCSFARDFDVSVDYALVEWPTANGTNVALQLVFGSGVVYLERQSFSTGGERYTGVVATPRFWFSLPTTDVRGALRMKRVGSRIYAYYRTYGQWTEFTSIDYGPDPARIRLIVWGDSAEIARASGSEFAHEDVSVDFSNFAVEGPPPECP